MANDPENVTHRCDVTNCKKEAHTPVEKVTNPGVVVYLCDWCYDQYCNGDLYQHAPDDYDPPDVNVFPDDY